jgi:hypothetical protein
MNKFEQLIEYVINDEDQKARELFHDIVVAKSREIYESMMDDELEESVEEVEEGDMGGDAQNDLIDSVEMDEESELSMEAEDEPGMDDDEEVEVEFGDEDSSGGDEPATKDDVMNLEDKLDQLMAEFEDLMGGDNGDGMGDGDDFGPEEGGDAIEMDDTEEMMPMAEALSLKAAPKPVTSEQGGTNTKSNVAANSGARGALAKPVHTGASEGGHHDSAAYRNTTKEVGVTPTQDAGKGAFKTAAPKPVTSQASGVNNKSPLPGGRG